jgi:hypothetical protein
MHIKKLEKKKHIEESYSEKSTHEIAFYKRENCCLAPALFTAKLLKVEFT